MIDTQATNKASSQCLGGLYEHTQASQGKAGSATDVMNPAKLQMTAQGKLSKLHNKRCLKLVNRHAKTDPTKKCALQGPSFPPAENCDCNETISSYF